MVAVTYGIQALAKEDILSYNEMVFKPSTIEFTVDKRNLLEFEQMNPTLEPIIKALLRSYEGIFDYPVPVYETMLAKFLKRDTASCISQLRQLHQYGVIRYITASEKPQIYLQKNRMYSDDFKIDTAMLMQRRQVYEERLDALQQYISNASTCREKLLSAYFSAPTARNCGICDNCINNHLNNLTTEQFDATSDKIDELLSGGSMEINSLVKNLAPISQRDAWQVIQFLLSEEVLQQTSDNQIGKRTNT